MSQLDNRPVGKAGQTSKRPDTHVNMKTASDTQLDDEEKKLSNRRVFILLDGTGNDFKKTVGRIDILRIIVLT